MGPVLSICCPQIRFRFRFREISFSVSFACLACFFSLFFLGGATAAAALKSEAAVDGNRKEVADRFPARLGSIEPENYATRASALRGTNTISLL